MALEAAPRLVLRVVAPPSFPSCALPEVDRPLLLSCRVGGQRKLCAVKPQSRGGVPGGPLLALSDIVRREVRCQEGAVGRLR